MKRAVVAEWTKLRTIRSTPWTLFGLLASSFLLSTLVGSSSFTEGCPDGAPDCNDDTVEMSLAGVWVGQLAVAVLAVLAICSEYASGTIRATFAAEPRRRRVLAAKSVVLGVLVFVAGLVTMALAYLAARSLLAGNGYTEANSYPVQSLLDGAVPRAVLGSALYLAGIALLSLGIGAIVRHSAAAITAVVAVLLVPLLAASMVPQSLGLDILRLAPMTAGLAIVRTVERADSVPISPWAGLGVLMLYAAAALAAAFWLIDRRDA